MTNFRTKVASLGVVAALSISALGLGGIGTTDAAWQMADDTRIGTIQTGELRLDSSPKVDWTITVGDVTQSLENLSGDIILIPGTVIEGKAWIKPTLAGQTLSADLVGTWIGLDTSLDFVKVSADLGLNSITPEKPTTLNLTTVNGNEKLPVKVRIEILRDADVEPGLQSLNLGQLTFSFSQNLTGGWRTKDAVFQLGTLKAGNVNPLLPGITPEKPEPPVEPVDPGTPSPAPLPECIVMPDGSPPLNPDRFDPNRSYLLGNWVINNIDGTDRLFMKSPTNSGEAPNGTSRDWDELGGVAGNHGGCTLRYWTPTWRYSQNDLVIHNEAIWRVWVHGTQSVQGINNLDHFTPGAAEHGPWERISSWPLAPSDTVILPEGE